MKLIFIYGNYFVEMDVWFLNDSMNKHMDSSVRWFIQPGKDEQIYSWNTINKTLMNAYVTGN